MKLFKSKAGFTLIELLVVIGILAVLAAIAIPSVAGLIDRANVSADKTNSNEMTNAIERFASEYELYCQDIASGALDPNNLDSTQGRVKNVIGATTRAEISAIEFAQDATVADDVVAIYRDTKYPMNAYTMQKVVENYTKTSSSTFEPKQSDMHYWYSPDCGVVVFAEPDADIETDLNSQIQSGQDAKGNGLGPTTQWIDLTLGATLGGDASLDLSTINTNLSTNTWEEVYKVISAGKAVEAGWKVGDTKKLTINGSEKTARIIGLDHDGENTATFMIWSNIGSRGMNNLDTNAGGWKDSEMRKWLNGDVYESMNNKTYIKEVTKMSNNVGEGCTEATATKDKVFLLSVAETGLNYDYDIDGEGTVYEWLKNNNDFYLAFWLRSASSSSSCVFHKYNYGSISGDYAHMKGYNIFPVFVIG